MTTIQNFLSQTYDQAIDGDSLSKIRAKAWERFQTLGLPSRKSEVFRHVRLGHLYGQEYVTSEATVDQTTIQTHLAPGAAPIVLINGRYIPTLSSPPEGLVVSSLSDAMKTYGTFLRNRWTQTLKRESDPFAILNGALHTGGLFLYLPPKTKIEQPVQVLHFICASDKIVFAAPRLHCFVGETSELTLLSTTHGQGAFWANPTWDFAIEQGGHLTFEQTLTDISEGWVFDALRATLKRDARLHTTSITDGSIGVRNDYDIVLAGEGADAALNGMALLKNEAHAHTHVRMEHVAPHCTSHQLFKSVLHDRSTTSFEGKIYVHKEAQKTDAFQLNNTLLLSDHAKAHSKPNLEIFADDVKASHGSTVGQLDKETIFYLTTRGIPSKQAEDLLIRGFVGEVTDRLKHLKVSL